jgi:hypothetical protein
MDHEVRGGGGVLGVMRVRARLEKGMRLSCSYSGFDYEDEDEDDDEDEDEDEDEGEGEDETSTTRLPNRFLMS